MQNLAEVWKSYYKSSSSKDGSPRAQALLALSDVWTERTYPSKQEYWKYVPFSSLARANYILANNEKVNRIGLSESGVLSIEINSFDGASIEVGDLPKGVSVLCPRDLVNKEGVWTHWGFESSTDPFVQSLRSFWEMGFILVIDEEVVLDQPIQLTYQLDSYVNQNVLAPFQIKVVVGKRARVEWLNHTQAEKFMGFANTMLSVELGEGSHFEYCGKEWGGQGSQIMAHLHCLGRKDSNFLATDVTFSGLWSRHNVRSDLLGKGAQSQLRGVYLSHKNHFCDHHTEIRHAQANTQSEQVYKGILNDQTRAVFNGKVFIAPGAKGSHSQQLNKNLVLSNAAEIDTKPELQIYNDDVKATHGATIGQIDPEQVFYLQSRGLSKEVSWKMLSRAFVHDLFESVSQNQQDFLHEDLDRGLAEVLGGQNGL
ncbi:MAG: Fe-S cluster assembly protein SufD [Bdellovibrionales bacterium]|nr:Fe-S cluster assembly protein SufD [Bdellovibrionales bacterium]